MSVRLRPRTPADDARLVDIFVTAWHHGYPGIVPADVLAAVDVPTVTGWFARWSDDGGLATTVAEQGGVVAGFARYGVDPDDPDPDVGYLAALYVHPDAAGRGVGRALVDHAVDVLAAQGRTAMTLWVFRDNVRARRLYHAAGFAPDGSELTDRRWRTPQIRMRRRLMRSVGARFVRE